MPYEGDTAARRLAKIISRLDGMAIDMKNDMTSVRDLLVSLEVLIADRLGDMNTDINDLRLIALDYDQARRAELVKEHRREGESLGEGEIRGRTRRVSDS